jgi:hypothetical protein
MIRKPGAALVALLPAAGVACSPALGGDDVRRIEGQQVVVAWRAPAKVPLADFFAIDFAVCSRDGKPVASARVDATMPQHGHGMNYRPQIEELGNGRFRAVGLLLHMPGDWRLSFHVSGSGGAEALHTALRVD